MWNTIRNPKKLNSSDKITDALLSKKKNQDLELDPTAVFGHASGWDVQWFAPKVEYIATNDEPKHWQTASKPELICGTFFDLFGKPLQAIYQALMAELGNWYIMDYSIQQSLIYQSAGYWCCTTWLLWCQYLTKMYDWGNQTFLLYCSHNELLGSIKPSSYTVIFIIHWNTPLTLQTVMLDEQISSHRSPSRVLCHLILSLLLAIVVPVLWITLALKLCPDGELLYATNLMHIDRTVRLILHHLLIVTAHTICRFISPPTWFQLIFPKLPWSWIGIFWLIPAKTIAPTSPSSLTCKALISWLPKIPHSNSAFWETFLHQTTEITTHPIVPTYWQTQSSYRMHLLLTFGRMLPHFAPTSLLKMPHTGAWSITLLIGMVSKVWPFFITCNSPWTCQWLGQCVRICSGSSNKWVSVFIHSWTGWTHCISFLLPLT